MDQAKLSSLMNMLIKTYYSLLADISQLSKCPLGAPDDLPMSWVLVEGPKLDKALLGYIENNELEKPIFPEWLSPLWERFLAKNEAVDLMYLRQCLVFCYKAEFEPSTEQIVSSERSFRDVDLDVGLWDAWFNSQDTKEPLFRSARSIVGSVIYRINWRDLIPSHGPGAVFPSRIPSEKSCFSVYYNSICQLYPYDQYFCGLYSFWNSTMVENDHLIESKDDIVCRLTAVPKDSRGPRLICVHPAESIWIQQGQRRLLEGAISRSPIGPFINFKDQTVNGQMALKSSLSREYCTLDLKDASDRISLGLVRYLFGGAYQFLASTRASHVVYSDNRVEKLYKFAPMGNCLTFPIESLVFYSLVRASIRCQYGIDCVNIYVFGDDIVFPSKYATGVLKSIERAGLVPNLQKTFVHGFFRESCGVDAYRGTNITPYRMKVHNTDSYSALISLCDLAKRLRLGGYEFTSSFIYSSVRKVLGKLHLSNNPDTQGIFEYVSSLSTLFYNESSIRFNRHLHRWETRVLLVQGLLEGPHKDDWYHLQDSLLSLELSSKPNRDRRTEYPVPYRARPTYGWTSIT